VLLVHGTFAKRAEGDQEKNWWEKGSAFRQKLAVALGTSGGYKVFDEEIEWSGLNSEVARHQAGRDLLQKLLLPMEAEGRPYHLIGHSQGGSVIWAALREAARRKRPLNNLASWSTVGTPLLQYALLQRSLRGYLALFVRKLVATFFVIWYFLACLLLVDQLAKGLLRAHALPRSLVALFGLLWLGWLVVSVSVRLFYPFHYNETLHAELRAGSKAARAYGEKWLVVWSPHDEAINGLRDSIRLAISIIPRPRLTAA